MIYRKLLDFVQFAVNHLTQNQICCRLLIAKQRGEEMQARKWNLNQKSVTMYVTEAEYQLITSKAEILDVSASKFAKQAVKTYIKHLERHLEDAASIAA
jgi:hypothetical protein